MDEDSGIGVETRLGFDPAVLHTRLALRTHGFSVLSEMPAPVELGGLVGRRHLFLALWEQPTSTSNLGGPGLDVGDHLPCSVVVFEQEGRVSVASMDPAEGLEGGPIAFNAQAARTALIAAMKQIAGESR